MKKKFRNITVDDKKYAWQAKGQSYKIWFNEKVILEGEFSGETITPKNIRGIILKNTTQND